MLSIALISRALQVRLDQPAIYRATDGILLVSVLLCLAIGLSDWCAKASLTAMVVLLLGPVAAGIVVWLKHTEPKTIDLD